LKRLLSHLHLSCTRHSISHVRAFNRADGAEAAIASITEGLTTKGVVVEVAHLDAISLHEHSR
jgi:hypothetical protein